jgi:hypothetical protein
MWYKQAGGDNNTTMRTLYISLIRSVTDYGSILYGTATKSYIDNLDARQHTCLHITNGI